jgi:DNA/RNA-binding domain of Phe-tRNA-synthetase-like protein
MKIDIQDNLPIRISARVINDIIVSNNSSAFQELIKVGQSYRNNFANLAISQIDGIQEARTFFRAIGIDPTKRRPSSEALLRRALNNKDFYQINNVVDVANLVSLKSLLPVCVYDYDAIQGQIFVKLGSHPDEYLAHNHRIMNFQDKFVICDELGPFGSPLTDSLRTAVTKKTSNVLALIFAPKDYNYQKLEDYLDQIMLGMKN